MESNAVERPCGASRCVGLCVGKLGHVEGVKAVNVLEAMQKVKFLVSWS